MTLTFDHFHISGDIAADIPFLKNIGFDIQKPNETLVLHVSAPIVNDIKIELNYVHFQNDILTLHILSNRKIVDILIVLLNRYTKSVVFFDIDYPTLRINTRILSNMYFPKIKIRNITIVNQQYIVETELS